MIKRHIFVFLLSVTRKNWNNGYQISNNGKIKTKLWIMKETLLHTCIHTHIHTLTHTNPHTHTHIHSHIHTHKAPDAPAHFWATWNVPVRHVALLTFVPCSLFSCKQKPHRSPGGTTTCLPPPTTTPPLATGGSATLICHPVLHNCSQASPPSWSACNHGLISPITVVFSYSQLLDETQRSMHNGGRSLE